jgi:hypothetical protein
MCAARWQNKKYGGLEAVFFLSFNSSSCPPVLPYNSRNLIKIFKQPAKKAERTWRHAVKNPLLPACSRCKQIIKDAVKIAAANEALEWRPVN